MIEPAGSPYGSYTPYVPSIVYAFLNACERHPARPCIVFDEHTYTYAQIHQAAGLWACGLHAWQLRPGDRVALFLDNSPAFVVAYLGTLIAGGIVVLVNTQYRQVELRHLLHDSGARVCITTAEHQTSLMPLVADLPDLQSIVRVGAEPDLTSGTTIAHAPFNTAPVPFHMPLLRLPTLPTDDQIALIGYTSGTTGRSKGAMLSHGNLVANSIAVTTAWHWTYEDRLLLTLPLFHIHGLGVGVNGSFVTGGCIDLRRRFDAADVYDALCSGQITLFFGVPTMYTRLIAEAEQRQANGESPPPPIRLSVSGSAPLDPQTFADFERLFGQTILERYGMTETGMNLTNPYAGECRPGTVGHPFPGQEARVVDQTTRQPLGPNQAGEIQVRGRHVFQGYWRQTEATAEVFDADGWFSTGDLGWYSEDGYFTIAGRARELIISGGYNIYPREVEDVLLSHPAVAEAAVVGLPDADLGEQVVAVIVPRQADDEQQLTHELLADTLIDLCRSQLAGYKKPRQVLFRTEIPRNALGKIQKHLLVQQLTERTG